MVVWTILYQPDYAFEKAPHNLSKSKYWNAISALRAKNDFLLISHTRQCWGNSTDLNCKANDKLIRAWSLFIKEFGANRKKLILFEYGTSVSDSKRLIDELSLRDTIVWMPLMTRKDLMPLIFLCDVVASEFQHSWLAGGVIYEALSQSEPLIAYRDPNEHHQNLYPIFNAFTVDEIYLQIVSTFSNKELRVSIGQKSKEWLDNEYCAFVDFIERLFSETLKNNASMTESI